MTTQRRNWWNDFWQQLPAALAEIPLLTAGEQTKLSWARPIETPEAASPSYAEVLAALTARAGCFPTCILTPSYAGFLTRTTEKLVCFAGDEVAIFERAGEEVRSTIYALAEIDSMEVGCILLSSWLKIVGTDEHGRHMTTTIKFNSVTDYLFTPLLNLWRSAPGSPGNASLADEQAKFNHLSSEHYKFMNIGRRVILPGDRVAAAIMQPELRVPVVGLFGHVITRSKAPAHIVVLTDRELIIATEEKQPAWRAENRYGSVTTYIPLQRIGGATIIAREDGCLQLSIELPGNEQVQVDFAAERQADVQQLANLLSTAQPVTLHEG